mmetsp:Transcript_2450/g.6541  ORF Transcript_2450/g.6541 Transcript_2450/m.6541 type:complete len:254 (-) Transcript_2450:1226-1987(-)
MDAILRVIANDVLEHGVVGVEVAAVVHVVGDFEGRERVRLGREFHGVGWRVEGVLDVAVVADDHGHVEALAEHDLQNPRVEDGALPVAVVHADLRVVEGERRLAVPGGDDSAPRGRRCRRVCVVAVADALGVRLVEGLQAPVDEPVGARLRVWQAPAFGTDPCLALRVGGAGLGRFGCGDCGEEQQPSEGRREGRVCYARGALHAGRCLWRRGGAGLVWFLFLCLCLVWFLFLWRSCVAMSLRLLLLLLNPSS